MIRFHFFGSLDLRREDGTEVRSVLAQPKRTALLAYLAAQPQGEYVRRDALVAVLWPEMEDARARRALTKSLHFLRQSLGEGVIITRGEEDVGLDPGRFWSDVLSFREALADERFEEALQLASRGEPGAAFHLGDAPGFERWLDAERDRVRRGIQSAALTLSLRAQESGDLEGAVQWAHRILDADPLQEPATRRLMEFLDASGDRAGALALYERFSSLLQDELGAEPGPETRQAAERIRVREESVVGLPPVAPAPRSSVLPGAVAPSGRPETAADAAPGRAAGTSRSRRSRVVRLAVPATVVVGLAVAVARPWGGELQEGKILVVALENRTGDPALDPLGEMAADWLARGLQQTGLAQVVDPLSAIAMTRGISSEGLTGWRRAEALARGTGVTSVMWGSIYRQGDSLYLEAQVSDLAQGEVVLGLGRVASAPDEPISAVERLQQRTLGALATRRDRRVRSQLPARDRPPSYRAYEEFVNALELFQESRTDEAFLGFMAAFQADSTFYLPLTWAAFTAGNDGRTALRDSVIDLLEAARPRLAPLDRHALDYFLAFREDPGSDAWHAPAEAAARLSPGSAWSYNAGRAALAQGRVRDAVAYLETVDGERGWPGRWIPYWRILVEALHLAGEDGRALDAARRIRALAPDDPSAVVFEVSALAGMGRVGAADSAMTDLRQRSGPEEHLELHYLHAGRELMAHGFGEAAEGMWQGGADWIRSPSVAALLAADGDSWPAWYRRWNGARILLELGRWEEAAVVLDTLAASEWAGLRAGDLAAARGLLAAAQGQRQKTDSLAALVLAQDLDLYAARIWMMAGDTARAREALQRHRPRPRWLLEAHRVWVLAPLLPPPMPGR